MDYDRDMEYDRAIEIRYMLDLYFDGQTTLEQERRLREHFLSEEVHSDLLYAKGMFVGFANASRQESSANAAKDDRPIFQEDVKGEHSALRAERKRRRWIRAALSAAASLIIAVAGVWMSDFGGKPTVYCYVNGEPVTDVDMAARQAQMAVRLLQGSARASADGIARFSAARKSIEYAHKSREEW